MYVLVTGGAGYIGSVVTEELINDGYKVVVLDNLQQGHREAVSKKADFILGDVGYSLSLERIFQQFDITAVMHLAADSLVGESMTDPRKFLQNNVVNGLALLNAMLKKCVRKFIFSSTAAVYGSPEIIPISEKHTTKPVNAYGDSKLMFEKMLELYGMAYDLQHVSLRYFNAAGATKQAGEAHHPETHLIPSILRVALDQSGSVSVYGTDYPTKDGSCIRDYIHVADIARAHLIALEKLERLSAKAYNLGNGNGYSVLEVIETARRITGFNIPVKLCDRRAGDPGKLVASSNLAKTELGWEPRYKLEAIIESAWQWMLQHPEGYVSKDYELTLTGINQ